MSIFPPQAAPPILIVLIAGIGDLVLASAAIRAIRNGHPGAEIHLLTSTDAVPLAANYPYIDHVHAFPIRELRKSKTHLFDIIRIIRDLRGTAFDKLLNLYRVSSPLGAAKMGLLFSFLKAETRIGHDRYGFGRFLTERLPAGTFTGRHVVEAMREIALRAGGIPDGKGIEVFWNADITSKWEGFFAPLAGRVIVGINPGGDRANRRWAPERFAWVAEEIIGRFNAAVIILGGPAEVPIASDIVGRIPSDVLNLAGKTPVDALPYIISRMDLLLTNDSGPMHIAAATKTPLIALFGPEDPKLFGPYTSPELYRVIHKELPCRPCGDKRCTSLSCLKMITAEEVLAACCERLHR
jgi:lipopolysaccharide heptosyltransferase II